MAVRVIVFSSINSLTSFSVASSAPEPDSRRNQGIAGRKESYSDQWLDNLKSFNIMQQSPADKRKRLYMKKRAMLFYEE